MIGEVEVEQRGRQDGKKEVEDLDVGFERRQLHFCDEAWMRAAAVAVLGSTSLIHLLLVAYDIRVCLFEFLSPLPSLRH